jgi:hypothetical protein
MGDEGAFHSLPCEELNASSGGHVDMSINFSGDYSETRMPFELTLKYLLNSMNVLSWTSLYGTVLVNAANTRFGSARDTNASPPVE